MFGKQVKFIFFIILLCCGAAFTSCHSSGKKESQQKKSKKNITGRVDTGKIKPAVKEIRKGPAHTYVILNTLVGDDKIKVVLYNDTMIKCSLNKLTATFNSAKYSAHWDETFYDNMLILVPGEKNFRRFILNDSLLIIPLSCGVADWDTEVLLYLLKRTKNSLEFVKGYSNNPIVEQSCMYVDLANNTIMAHGGHMMYDNNEGSTVWTPYEINRYKIVNSHFIKTNSDTLTFEPLPESDNVDDENSFKGVKLFYSRLLRHINWKRDKYSSIYRKMVVVDTVVGKDTLRIGYDNKGNISCTVNKMSDTVAWDESWRDIAWGIGKNVKYIIVPGENKPRSFVLSKYMVLFTIMNKDLSANLFIFNRKDALLESFVINNHSSYVYVDLKGNIIYSYVNSSNDRGFDKNSPFDIYRYDLRNNKVLIYRNEAWLFDGEDSDYPSGFSDFQYLYEYIAKHQPYRRILPDTIVNDLLKNDLFTWYIYYSKFLAK